MLVGNIAASNPSTTDIGTVIAPDAEVKLFITASTQARAEQHTYLQAYQSSVFSS